MSRVGWKRALFRRDSWRCHYCRCGVNGRDAYRTEFATIDHLTPLSRGGMSIESNMVTACRGCNEGKGCMTADEYLAAGSPKREYRRRLPRLSPPHSNVKD